MLMSIPALPANNGQQLLPSKKPSTIISDSEAMSIVTPPGVSGGLRLTRTVSAITSEYSLITGTSGSTTLLRSFLPQTRKRWVILVLRALPVRALQSESGPFGTGRSTGSLSPPGSVPRVRPAQPGNVERTHTVTQTHAGR